MLWFDNFLDEAQKFRNASEEDRKAMTQSLQNQIKTRELDSQVLKEIFADDEIIKARVEEFKDADDETRVCMLNELYRSLRDRGIKQNDADRMCNTILWDKLTEISNQIQSKKLEEYYEDRYKIFQPIKDWCEKYYYADFLVTIKADEWNCTTVLYGGDLRDHNAYSFLDDWDEGQKEVELVGFIPIDSIEVHINGENFPSNMVLHLYEDRANYETIKLKGD